MRKYLNSKSVLRFGRNAFLLGFFLFLTLNFLFPFHPRVSYSTLVLSAEGRPMKAFLSPDDKWRLYIEEAEITEALREAFLLKEDRWFYYHPGFNPVSLIRALVQNLRSGQRRSGASTITMQVVRLLEPRERTYGNKVIEVFRAFQLEWNHSKDEILQLYLNLVPYGGNVEGIKAASLFYFQCLPAQLSPARIATLSVVPNRPGSWKLRPGNAELKSARDRWLRYYYRNGWIDTETLETALGEEPDIQRTDQEIVAPHLCNRLFHQYGQPIIRSHIRYELQRKSEELTRQYIQSLYPMGITNAAVLVIDNQSGQVVAYVGSADYDNKNHQGEVDGVRAVRSPGSTLKPFAYGWAIEKGLICPKTILYDAPMNYGGYVPENYDARFHGAVSTEFALAHSLNIPAVSVLQELGSEEFIRKMSNSGFEQIRKDQSKLGLSMILGGCGVRLEELCNAYASLANYGEFRPLRYVESDSALLRFQFMSPEASFLVSDILTGLSRPDLPFDWQSSKSVPRIAWKTGTSYGRRDGWSIGYNRDYTIGVWTGNFDNTGSPELSGAEIATPLLFRLFSGLFGESIENWLHPTSDLSIRPICTETGKIPGPHCVNKGSDYYIPGVSKHEYCNCRQELMTNAHGDLIYCRTCAPDEYRKQVFRVIPAPLIRYFEAEHLPYASLPPHNPACPRINPNEGPRIIHPTNKAEYLFEKEEKPMLALQAEADPEVKEVYWYLNDRYLGAAKSTETFMTEVSSGEARISCTDDHGRTTHIRITVRRF